MEESFLASSPRDFISHCGLWLPVMDTPPHHLFGITGSLLPSCRLPGAACRILFSLPRASTLACPGPGGL